MNPDWLWAALGGVLIGLAAAWLWLGYGRIMGVSGILGSAVSSQGSERAWRSYFVIGVLLSPWVYQWAFSLPEIVITDHKGLLVLGGLLVGFGTRLGSGCTSGHGVCGLGRLSKRSLVATLTFMACGFVTVFVLRHVLGVGV